VYGRFDPIGKFEILSVGASDQDCGKAVLSALSASRFLEHPALTQLDWQNTGAIQDARWETLRTTFGYSSKRAMFKKLAMCIVKCTESSFRFIPMQQEKLDQWQSICDQEVVISGGASPEEVGKASNLALDRSIKDSG
jgi:hypothetical protein